VTTKGGQVKKISLVTGGGSGIGRATSIKLSTRENHVIVADIDEEGAAETVSRIKAAGGDASATKADVSDELSVAALMQTVAKAGRIDTLVNCAGILQNGSRVEDMDLAEHDRIWNVNYRGTYLCCRAFGPVMAEYGVGSIVNIGSIAGFEMFPLPAYSPSKAAIHQLTKVLAGDLGPRGVRVNAVAPGFVMTEALKARVEAGERDTSVMEEQKTLRRIVEPDEIADAILFLCSSAARAITGATLPVDNGWLAGLAYNTYAGNKKN
jgi:NAD(P)-dependent dehydrogenase (short-subunit alcohol dehydrogenase family)